MASDAEHCQKMERVNDEDGLEVPVHQGNVVPPAQAWEENEDLSRMTDSRTNSPGQHRRLHSPNAVKQNRLQAALTLGVKDIKNHTKCPQILNKVKPKVKLILQKTKGNLIQVLKPPYFIITMIIVMVIIHMCGSETLGKWLEWTPTAWRREPWRLFTYGFIHGNASHLTCNAIVALAVGWCLEREQGRVRLAAVWTVALAAGALATEILQPRVVSVIGASAAVYALITVHIPNVILRYDHIRLCWFRLLSVLIIVVAEGIGALFQASKDGGGYAHVAWAAHAVGAAVGIPLGLLVFTGENSSKIYIQVCRAVSALLLIGGVVLVLVVTLMHASANFSLPQMTDTSRQSYDIELLFPNRPNDYVSYLVR